MGTDPAVIATLDGNPLYDAWDRMCETDPLAPGWTRYRDEDTWYERLRAATNEAESLAAVGQSPHQQRRELCARYSWAVPSRGAIQHLLDCGPVLEVGAGTGYWSALISAGGGDVLSFDQAPVHRMKNGWHPRDKAPHAWFPVKRADSVVALDHPERTLLVCWPPYDEPMAYEALVSYEIGGGGQLVFIGEHFGGCTGDARFFDRLEAGWDETGSVILPSWPGIHDYMTTWRRK